MTNQINLEDAAIDPVAQRNEVRQILARMKGMAS